MISFEDLLHLVNQETHSTFHMMEAHVFAIIPFDESEILFMKFSFIALLPLCRNTVGGQTLRVPREHGEL